MSSQALSPVFIAGVWVIERMPCSNCWSLCSVDNGAFAATDSAADRMGKPISHPPKPSANSKNLAFIKLQWLYNPTFLHKGYHGLSKSNATTLMHQKNEWTIGFCVGFCPVCTIFYTVANWNQKIANVWIKYNWEYCPCCRFVCYISILKKRGWREWCVPLHYSQWFGLVSTRCLC